MDDLTSSEESERGEQQRFSFDNFTACMCFLDFYCTYKIEFTQLKTYFLIFVKWFIFLYEKCEMAVNLNLKCYVPPSLSLSLFQ